MSTHAATEAIPAAPTHNIEAEQIVLGAMLISRDALEDINDILTPGDFYRPNHATIYNAILNRYTAGEPTDPNAVSLHLIATGEHERTGGRAYLSDLIATVPTAANGTWHARIVAENAGRRRLTETALAVAQAATNPGLTLAEAQDRAGSALTDAISNHQTSGPARAGDLIGAAFQRIEDAGKQQGIRGLTTGLIDLDKLTSGLQPGRMYVIAARPGVGKTVAALDIVRANAIHRGISSLFVTLEMGTDEVMDRIIAAESSVPHKLIQDGALNENQWTQLARHGATIADAPLFIDDTITNLIQLRARARRLKQQHGLGLIAVDYLQLMTSAKKVENRQQEVADLSRNLKLLSKELDIPVIAISQLNRGTDTRSDKRPGLADLRESGAIEQDADMVILLYREDYYDKEVPRAGEIDFIVAKNRHGPTDTVTAAAQLHLMRFVDMAIA